MLVRSSVYWCICTGAYSFARYGLVSQLVVLSRYFIASLDPGVLLVALPGGVVFASVAPVLAPPRKPRLKSPLRSAHKWLEKLAIRTSDLVGLPGSEASLASSSWSLDAGTLAPES